MNLLVLHIFQRVLVDKYVENAAFDDENTLDMVYYVYRDKGGGANAA